ncbi:MAG: Mu transposase domain-containing protein, partial [Pseudonocardiaceae bacterium]
MKLAEEVKVLRPLPSLRAAIQRGVARKVDRLATVRFGSARYSLPARLIGTQVWVSVAGDQILIDAGDQRAAEHPLIAP